MFGRTSGTFTYVSDAHNSTSWLDHFICSHGVQSLVTNIHIIDKLPSSDHLPVDHIVSSCVISDKHNSVPKKKQQVKQCPIFKWTEANDFDIRKFGNSTVFRSYLISSIHVRCDLPLGRLTFPRYSTSASLAGVFG